MGMLGSETALEELMCCVLGDLIHEGVVAKVADDLYCGADSPEGYYRTGNELPFPQAAPSPSPAPMINCGSSPTVLSKLPELLLPCTSPVTISYIYLDFSVPNSVVAKSRGSLAR